MGQKNIFGEDIAEWQRRKDAKAATESLTAIKDKLQEEQWDRQKKERDQEKSDRLQALKSQEKLAQYACESFRKAVEVDPAYKIKIAGAVVSQINEELLLGSLSLLQKANDTERKGAKTWDKVDLDGHLLGSHDGRVFKRAENTWWGYATLLRDFKYYCVTHRDHRPFDYAIIDKVEYTRDDLGEFLLSANKLSDSDASKCAHLQTLWDKRKKEKSAELQEIVAALPRIKSHFIKRLIIKWAIIVAIASAPILWIISRVGLNRTFLTNVIVVVLIYGLVKVFKK